MRRRGKQAMAFRQDRANITPLDPNKEKLPREQMGVNFVWALLWLTVFTHMKNSCFFPLVVLVIGALCMDSAAIAAEDSLVTAVYSNVSNGYTREKMPDGSFKRETYAISNGGYSPGLSHDESIDAVKFPTIAGVVAQHLARQNYFLAQDSKSADLLLVISWGKTIPFNDGLNRNSQDQALAAMNTVRSTVPGDGEGRSADGIQSPAQAINGAAKSALEGALFELQMFNSIRERANEKNARLLGYMKEINSRNNMSRFAGAGSYYDDLISDIENDRYYVIVNAYDFRAATQEKQKKILWSTRVSIQSQGNQFTERLMAMIDNASRHFGQDSGQLIRQYQRSPRVDLKELKFLGLVPDSDLKRDSSKQN